MKYRISISREAQDNLKDMDKGTANRILDKLEYYAGTPDPFTYAKPLQAPMKGLYRFRIGDYRAIFEKDARGTITLLVILRIEHRKDVYD